MYTYRIYKITIFHYFVKKKAVSAILILKYFHHPKIPRRVYTEHSECTRGEMIISDTIQTYSNSDLNWLQRKQNIR